MGSRLLLLRLIWGAVYIARPNWFGLPSPVNVSVKTCTICGLTLSSPSYPVSPGYCSSWFPMFDVGDLACGAMTQ